MKRGFAAIGLLIAAVLVQTALVDRLPLPWGVAPDLVILVVVAIALSGTSAAGAFAGFCGGLAVDVLPPADHEIGRYALLLCLAGYAVGSLRESNGRSWLWPLGVAAGATLAVCLGFAFIGMVLGDPRVGLGAVAVVVPATLLMTMVLSPFVLYPALWLLRRMDHDEFAAIGDAPWLSRGVAR
ncbi:rod shape-determining protein MreD [Murinocardiopsis flavida]|uniref:Rod shape-determining protein MreD n=1 Tax=Murinocardiopsis flavida TaxID=645275 RepID=A0A2P8DU87_9ACTN|nr:rod shape-determining protein MreD [Murinocardiopsis flavida]PSL00781.1 rod shape-determining protein MreD [Murinocardiopsis flavida]